MLQSKKFSLEKLALFFLCLSIATSSIVTVEPALTDILFLIFVSTAIICNKLYFEKESMSGFFLLTLFLLINLLSLFWISSISTALSYLAITFYMAIIWFGIVGISGVYGVKIIQVITRIYFLVGLLTAIAALLVYFKIVPYNESLFMFDRVKLWFKDPNVLGPYLVLPALYAAAKFEEKGKIFYLISFILIGSGIVLSFSRAAWLNLFISIVIFLLIPKFKQQRNRLRLMSLFIILGIVGVVAISANDILKNQFVERLGIQQYDEERFDSQKSASIMGLTAPLGKGPGQSEVLLEIAPHNLYARLLIENGLLGVITFILFVLFSLYNAYRSIRQSNENRYYYMIVFSVIIGQCINSMFIDTLHWRHFWILIALAWIPNHKRRI